MEDWTNTGLCQIVFMGFDDHNWMLYGFEMGFFFGDANA
jgi:hypothetical protein